MGRLGWCGRRCARGLLAVLLVGVGATACGREPARRATALSERDAGADGGYTAYRQPGPEAGPGDASADTLALGPVRLTAKVSGLLGSGLVLRSASGEERAVWNDGDVIFAALVSPGAELVSVVSQPRTPSQTCRARADGGNVSVLCETNSFAVGGIAVGLEGTGLVLEDARGQRIELAGSGAFHFAEPLPDLAYYALRLVNAPAHPRQACTLQGAEGQLAGADVDSVIVTCTTERFAIGGSVHGLLGAGLTLELDGAETIAIAADGPFAFAGTRLDGSAFAVRVKTQPGGPDQRCLVLDGERDLDGAPVSDVQVVCGALGGLRVSEVGSCYYANSACWFELYNAGTAPEQLAYYQLRSPSSLGVAPYTVTGARTFALPSATLVPGAYLVVQAASTESLADGQGVVHVADGSDLPWWAESGFIELTTAGQTVDFVRFGESVAQPLSAHAWSGSGVAGLPSGASAHGYAIARDVAQSDRDHAGDWVVRAFATPGGPNDVAADADVDRDGVPDSAELSGGKFAGLDLYAMGARVGPRDMFIEVDRMDSSDPAVQPRREALDAVVGAFAKRGIAVHFDVGDLFVSGFDPGNYNLGGGDVVPYANEVGFGPGAPGVADIYEYKAAHMAAARRSLFYYQLFALSQDNDSDQRRSAGIGERPGNDTIITLGGIGLGTSTTANRNKLINYQAATIMHELGHNLGLRHGGGDDLNYKPNYVSVMNYLYSPVGLPTIGWLEGDRYDFYRRCTLFATFQLTNAPTGDPSKFVIDFSDGLSGDLDERGVLESEGLGRADSKSVDYNCNGRTDGAYARDLNDDGRSDLFVDHDDWSNLDLVFRRSYSGNENGPNLLFPEFAEPPHDVLTDDVQPTGDHPCPPAGR